MRAAASHRQPRLGLAGRALGIAALVLGLAVPAASATEPLKMSFTDPVDQADPGLDLIGGTISEDTITGTINAQLQFAGDAAATPTGVPAVSITAGFTAPDGTCKAVDAVSVVITARRDLNALSWRFSGTGTKSWTEPTSGSSTGTLFDVEVKDDALVRTTATCALVATGITPFWPTIDFTSVDEVTLHLELGPTRVGGQTSGNPVADADRDGVTDASDPCPNDPGPKSSGCPETMSAKSLRLGARRLVVDRLMTMAQGTTACPAVVKVVVTQAGHRLGAAKLPTVPVADQDTRCAVKGVVRLKRHKKRAYVRAVLTGAGLAPEAQQIRG